MLLANQSRSVHTVFLTRRARVKEAWYLAHNKASWNLGDTVVVYIQVHLQLSHNSSPTDGALVGARSHNPYDARVQMVPGRSDWPSTSTITGD
jgi:hypothetical protein